MHDSTPSIQETAQHYGLSLPFAASDWQIRQGLPSIMLIAAGGTQNDDFALAGQMAETALLQAAPHIKQVLMRHRLLSRCKLVRVPQGEHDLQEQSFHRFIREVIIIPVVHLPDVRFYQDDLAVSWSGNERLDVAGHCGLRVANPNAAECVYLICETKVRNNPHLAHDTPLLEPYQFEVLQPETMRQLLDVISGALAVSALNADVSAHLQQQLHGLAQNWADVFARFGHDRAGELSYQDVLIDFSMLMHGKLPHLHAAAKRAMNIVESVLKIHQAKAKRHFSRYFFAAQQPLPSPGQCPRFEKPIFIISAPRAGSTLLFETLAQFPEVWTIGEESHELIEDIPSLHPAAQGYQSNRLTEAQATPEVVAELKQRFVRQLRNRAGGNYLKLDPEQTPQTVRFLEKTPKNALRIPFLKAAFPDALFVYLYRQPEENISSLLEGWRSLRFVAYRNLPGWAHRQWSFFLPEGWQALHSAPLAAIAAHQWRHCNDTIARDLQNIPADDCCRVSYADLVAQPQATLMQIAHFLALDNDNGIQALLAQSLPVSKLALSNPAANKWHKYAAEISPITDIT